MPTPLPNDLQRFTYWQGQLLRSVDFRDQSAIAAQLRWWHNRAVHNAYGIAEGLQVTRNGNTVTVEPGIAYDCFGRELMLSQPQVLTIPADLEDSFLLAQYQEINSSNQQNELSPACLPTKFKLTQRPRLLWKPSNSVKVRDGVILARLINRTTAPSDHPDFIPPRARAIARPRIGSGTTVPGATSWTSWRVSDGSQQIVVGFQVEIDTSSAGFTEIPCYFAWLQGSFWSSPKEQFLFASFGHISKVSVEQLTFNLWLPSIQTWVPSIETNQALDTEFLTFAQQQKLYVSWLGIQPFQKNCDRTEENYESA
ncbi:hypothetical protein ACF3DV_12180 [Chlorogloeopsis fritschii PCC 9212]|uniref:Uncharacterized protein n=1 Tax=Chlorogloeopsis fritschii PCC 6912 TaxID=211165 RepID=A0A3S0ZXH2_CHLFR|nr:hypothetical protein [Chlorogloeopsis fritschii]RUR74503.1 hypothetical protein PCC6912_52780 [Chlorogloeopsis fritschii PCC 6912]